MSRDARPVALWALFLAGLTGGTFAFTTESFSYGLLGGAAVATALLALVLLRRRDEGAVRVLPDLSYATVAFGVGLALALVGVVFGLWLLLPGAGVAALGLAGIARERRAERRAP